MSKIVRAVVLALPIIMLTATAAVAQANYPPSTAPTASVANSGGANQAGAGGTAFTGAPGIDTGTIVTAVLLVVGLSALYVGWRRAERLSDR
jgi:hypothetical protein